MAQSELKTVINDIIDDYNLDIIALLAIIIFGIYTFFIAPIMFVSTTDAVIDGHIINVTSRAGGQIIHSYIMKDQEVKKGDLIMEIDPKDYENELLKLETALEINKEKLKMFGGTNVEGVNDKADDLVKEEPQTAPPKYIKGSNNITHYSKTYEPEDLAQKNLARKKTALGDTLQNMTDINQAEINIPKPVIDKTKIDISNDSPESVEKEIKNIESQKEEIKLLISSTKIFAPQDGIISAVSIAQGDIVNPSDVLCTIIPKQVWVIARVHPSQLPKIQIGQSVKIKIPGYKNRTFKGTVTSVDTTAKVYQIKAAEQIAEVTQEGQVVQERTPAYQIKIEFVEDYSDFNLPPDTSVKARIKVKSFG